MTEGPTTAEPTTGAAMSRREAGRVVLEKIQGTGLAEIFAGPIDLPDLPGLPPRGITLSDDRIVAHLRLLRLPVEEVVPTITAAIVDALSVTRWNGATVELHVDDLAPEALPL